jgi:hypothetical protein
MNQGVVQSYTTLENINQPGEALICYAVGRLNIKRTLALSSMMSLYQLFTGTRVNYWKSLSLGFGYNCKAYDGSYNMLRSRSFPHLAFHP